MKIVGILFKARGEIQLSYKKMSRTSLSIMAISATVSLSSVLYFNNKPNAYEVDIDNRLVAYISFDNKALKTVNNLRDELNKRFEGQKLLENLTINKAKVDDAYITPQDKIEKDITNNSDLLVDAYFVIADNREAAVAANEREVQTALEDLKNFYIKSSGLEVKESNIKTKISYEKKRTLLSKVENVEEIVNKLKEANAKSANQIVVFNIKGIKKSTETISPAIDVKWSDDMTVGQSKLVDNGKEGQKAIEREVILENNKVINSKVVSEKITLPPKNKIVLQGRKNPILASTGSLLTPSRGAISSYFGLRWGKMHEGLDIAANMGDPIIAALDGTVVYSGWESGYGNVIKLQHQSDLMTIYGHCSKLEVSVGQKVNKGDEIGKVGSTGNSTGPHLHFEVRVNGVAQNPVAFLQ